MAKLKPEVFFVMSATGNIGYGRFEHPCWHKEEKEHIIRLLGIEIDYGEGTTFSLSDDIGVFEHIKMIEKYVDLNSLRKAGSAVNRSQMSVKREIQKHNQQLIMKGECPICAKGSGPYSKKPIEKRVLSNKPLPTGNL